MPMENPGRLFVGVVLIPVMVLIIYTGEVSTETLAAGFRELRQINGHFQGGKWNDDVDKWRGKKHRLMIELGSRLANGKYDKKKVIELMNSPDRIVRKGDELFKLIIDQPELDSLADGPYEFLVYYWRGKHDFLFFVCKDKIIVRSGWWYAGE
jgi:hypothetical protein